MFEVKGAGEGEFKNTSFNSNKSFSSSIGVIVPLYKIVSLLKSISKSI